ncbi:MAG: tetratricopeptide repeat protein, partial [Bacteroidales bacterium]|nr:tetratricopeptide repeat protein [Bacteroidales bacterium]
DKLATAVRKDLGESLQKIHLRTVPLVRATTNSLEALKCLSNANLAGGNSKYGEAKEFLQEAIELDPEFALAHANLASYYYWTNDRVKGEAHISIALNLLNRLTEKERLWIQAAVEGYRGNRDAALVKWGTYLSKYPNDYGGWFRLGYNYMRMGRYEESISAFTRSLEIYNDDDPNILINIASCYSLLYEYNKSVDYYQQAFRLNPDKLTVSNLNHEFGFTYVQMGELQKAREVFEKMTSEDDEKKARGNRSLALLSMYSGRYSEAISLIRESILIQKSLGNELSELRDRLYLAKMYQVTGLSVKYATELEKCSDLIFDAASEPMWYLILGKMFIRSGEKEKAELLLEEISKISNQGNRNDKAAYNIIKGEIELLKENHTESLELMESATTLRSDAYTLESLGNYFF